MKFRSDSKVTIDNSNSELTITIGPILDRADRCWVKYTINIDVCDFKIIKDTLNNATYDNITDNIIELSYGEFKSHFRINYISKTDYERKMTKDDFIKDLDFMRDEIIKCQNSINKYIQMNRLDIVNKYINLINNEQHKMFQVETKEQFNSYLDDIEILITEKEKEDIETVYTNISSMSSLSI